MITRVTEKKIKDIFRAKLSKGSTKDPSRFKKCLVDYFSVAFGSQESPAFIKKLSGYSQNRLSTFWKGTIETGFLKLGLLQKYPTCSLFPDELLNAYDLKNSVDLRLLFLRLPQKLNVQIAWEYSELFFDQFPTIPPLSRQHILSLSPTKRTLHLEEYARIQALLYRADQQENYEKIRTLQVCIEWLEKPRPYFPRKFELLEQIVVKKRQFERASVKSLLSLEEAKALTPEEVAKSKISFFQKVPTPFESAQKVYSLFWRAAVGRKSASIIQVPLQNLELVNHTQLEYEKNQTRVLVSADVSSFLTSYTENGGTLLQKYHV